MNLLFLANRTPYPPYRGDKLKIYHLAKRLSARHECHLCAFSEDQRDAEYLPELNKIFASVRLVPLPKSRSLMGVAAAFAKGEPFQIGYFQSPAMHQALKEVLACHRFDAVHVQHLRMAPYLATHRQLPRILDLPDAFSLYWHRRWKAATGAKAAFCKAEHLRLLRYEKAMLPQYQKALACSAEDAQYLATQHGLNNLGVLPNGVDLDTFYPRPRAGNTAPTLLFTGNMDYAPNVDAVQWMAQEILPHIRARVPGVRFIIAGQRPVKAVLALAGDGVEVTGFVKDLTAMYAAADVVVSPLRFGAGTQNKVLEGLAMGLPVVCTEVGFAGLGVQDGEGAFMRRDAAGFADACVALLENPALRKTTGDAGCAAMRTRFGWDAVAARLEGFFEEIIRACSADAVSPRL